MPDFKIEAGDILAVQGLGWFSDAIRRCTGAGPYSHIGIVTATAPMNQVTEALERVKTRPLAIAIADCKFAWILKPPYESAQYRTNTVLKALYYTAEDYGYWNIAMQGLDAEAGSKWFTQNFAETKWPICSMLAALCNPKWGLDPKSVTPNDFAKLDWPKFQIK